ncbi:hypothetical protein PMZ80_005878 [Knufia obscura]|uniref:DUF924-domain-containing protein n=2 Tax=Knufia TaxID=430999 RepID=A0AAN8I9M6_9EURO|nr:hypothetical protein PMZ80_005878 [Knufia obscura]KAK5954545.1 hypothetical protein OHC33_004267 [Knufia fluminis]
MTSANSPDPAIKEVLDFWFALEPKQWFQESEQLDEPITHRFGELVEKARLTDELDSTWLATPSGSLAMIILLDQFTRNIFRPGKHPNPGLSWSGDAKALQIAAQSIAKGYDKAIQTEYTSHDSKGAHHRYFFYMPFEHAEDLPSQIASCALFNNMKHEVEANRLRKQLAGEEETEHEKELVKWLGIAIPVAEKHRDCVAQIGRFPRRNEPLGRETTEAERKFLEEHPGGW